MFDNLFKSVVALATTPVTLVVDTLAIIPDAVEEKTPFTRTSAMLDVVGDNFKKAVEAK